MNTTITTAHEEQYSSSGKKRELGILLNLDANGMRADSLVYMYHAGTYTFFNTIIELNDFLLYGDPKTKRAYLEEAEFDVFYDSKGIDGLFAEHLTWL